LPCARCWRPATQCAAPSPSPAMVPVARDRCGALRSSSKHTTNTGLSASPAHACLLLAMPRLTNARFGVHAAHLSAQIPAPALCVRLSAGPRSPEAAVPRARAQAAARALARELPSPPIELALTEAALAVASRCSPARPDGIGLGFRPAGEAADGGGDAAGSEAAPGAGPPGERQGAAAAAPPAGPAPADVVPAAVLAFLRRKVRAPPPRRRRRHRPALRRAARAPVGAARRSGRGCSLARRAALAATAQPDAQYQSSCQGAASTWP